MSEEMSEYQKHKQKVSKESSKVQKELKILKETISYEVVGNKIIKSFKKSSGGNSPQNGYTIFVGNVKVKEKIGDRVTGKEVYTPAYVDLVKKGLLPDTYKLNKKGLAD